MSKQRTIRSLTIGGAAAAALALAATTPANAAVEVPEPEVFTSAFTVDATPDQVVNNDGTAAPGEPGASGTFEFRINSDLEIICYDITLNDVTGDYQSMADTATHIHEAAFGQGGPPRIAFPNPQPVNGDESLRTSVGCLQGPFTTGITGPDGADTGTGFTLAQIEANPTGFTGDSHTAGYVPGVVRGQLAVAELPVDPTPEPQPSAPAPEPSAPGTGGTGEPGTGTDPDRLAETGLDAAAATGLTLGGLAILAGAGLVIARRRAHRA